MVLKKKMYLLIRQYTNPLLPALRCWEYVGALEEGKVLRAAWIATRKIK